MGNWSRMEKRYFEGNLSERLQLKKFNSGSAQRVGQALHFEKVEGHELNIQKLSSKKQCPTL